MDEAPAVTGDAATDTTMQVPTTEAELDSMFTVLFCFKTYPSYFNSAVDRSFNSRFRLSREQQHRFIYSRNAKKKFFFFSLKN